MRRPSFQYPKSSCVPPSSFLFPTCSARSTQPKPARGRILIAGKGPTFLGFLNSSISSPPLLNFFLVCIFFERKIIVCRPAGMSGPLGGFSVHVLPFPDPLSSSECPPTSWPIQRPLAALKQRSSPPTEYLCLFFPFFPTGFTICGPVF